MTTRRALPALATVALLLVPWTVLVFDGSADLVFLWGLVNTGAWHVVSLWDYLFKFTAGPGSLPRFLLAWPVSTLLVLGAAGSALISYWGRGDRRVTAGLLALAALDHLWFALSVGGPGVLALPVGPALAGALAWWQYRR